MKLETTNKLWMAAHTYVDGRLLKEEFSAALEGAVLELLADVRKRKQLGATARRLVLAQQGATRRTLEALDFLIQPRLARAG